MHTLVQVLIDLGEFVGLPLVIVAVMYMFMALDAEFEHPRFIADLIDAVAGRWERRPYIRIVWSVVWAPWRTRPGVRGMIGRYHWRLLVRMGHGERRRHRHYMAEHKAWKVWMRTLDDDGWAYLSRLDPARAASELFRAAAGLYEWKGDHAGLVAFCVRRGLAPEDPVTRAEFYALTGQAEQRRALDPDGTLLAAAYRAASPTTRAALREALADPADLDVVGALARTGTGAARAARTPDTEAEIRYLTGQFARHRDWPGLWRLIQDMPVLDAVETMRLMDTRWRPDARHEHELFTLLASADPARLAIAAAALPTARGMAGLAALVERPQESWQRADLETALRAGRNPAVPRVVRPLRQLVIGCLDYRFGADVALGAVAAANDDIAIAQPDG